MFTNLSIFLNMFKPILTEVELSAKRNKIYKYDQLNIKSEENYLDRYEHNTQQYTRFTCDWLPGTK